MLKRRLFPIALVLVAVLIDQTLTPSILGGRTGLHCAAAAAALLGLRRGHPTGLLAGWLAAAAAWALGAGPLGLAMWSLGTTGFVAGCLDSTPGLDEPPIELAAVALLMLLEELLAALGARALLGARFDPAWAGLMATIVLVALTAYRPWMRQWLNVGESTFSRASEL